MRLAAFRRWIRTFPFLASFGIVVLLELIIALETACAPFVPDTLVFRVLLELLFLAWPLVLLLLCGCGWAYRSGDFGETLMAGAFYLMLEGLPMLVLILLAASGHAARALTPGTLALLALTVLGTGFREESIFRGLIVNLMGERYIRDRKGIWRTVLLSGVLFGLTHLGNLMAGVTLPSVLVQSATACAIGWAFGAIYLRGGSLWAMIFLHALIDGLSFFYALFFAELDGVVEAINTLGPLNLTPVIPAVLLTVFLLRKSQCPPVIRAFRQRGRHPAEECAEPETIIYEERRYEL